MDYLITTGHVPPQTIVSIRARRPLDDVPAFIQAAFPDLSGRSNQLGVGPSGPPFVIYHEFGADGIDAEVCVSVDQSVAAADKIESRMLPATTVVRTLHVGPYEELGEAYAAVSDWIREHGFEVAGR